MKGKLTDKQKAFVEEYLVDLNATQAAIRAGYSKKTAQQISNQLLLKLVIQDAIVKAQQKRSERTHVTADKVLRELARLSFSDLRNVMTDSGDLKSPQAWDDDTAASISSIEVVTRQTGVVNQDGTKEVEHVHKIKTWDKNSALEKLGKHLTMFTDRVQIDLKAEVTQIERRIVGKKTND